MKKPMTAKDLIDYLKYNCKEDTIINISCEDDYYSGELFENEIQVSDDMKNVFLG